MSESNGRTNSLGWIAFISSFAIQLIAATWIIAHLDAAIADLKVQVTQIVNVQSQQTQQIQQNNLDIKLMQQGVKR